MAGRIEPRSVAIGVPLGDAFACSGRADLETERGADDLAVKALAELGGGDADVPLQALSGGRAELPDPPVLEHSERWQQDQQRNRDERRSRRFSDPHEANTSTA